MDLRVGINLGTGGHRDLFLTIPALGVDVVADTYYFVLALQHSGVAVDAATVCQSIRNLLDQWCQAVSGCDGQSGVYLPFDFSDQSTGCLAVAPKGHDLRLSYGHTLREGWRVDPLNPGPDFRGIDDFRPHPDTWLDVSRPTLLQAIRDARDAVTVQDP